MRLMWLAERPHDLKLTVALGLAEPAGPDLDRLADTIISVGSSSRPASSSATSTSR